MKPTTFTLKEAAIEEKKKTAGKENCSCKFSKHEIFLRLPGLAGWELSTGPLQGLAGLNLHGEAWRGTSELIR